MYEKRVYELNQYLFGLLLPGTHVWHDGGGGEEEELQCCSVSAVQSTVCSTGHHQHCSHWSHDTPGHSGLLQPQVEVCSLHNTVSAEGCRLVCRTSGDQLSVAGGGGGGGGEDARMGSAGQPRLAPPCHALDTHHTNL